MGRLFERAQYIAIEGPIRVGKSTLANIIADRLNAQRVIEPEDNAFLRRFYRRERGARLPPPFPFLHKPFQPFLRSQGRAQTPQKVTPPYISQQNKNLSHTPSTSPQPHI